jgi:hypothetical protein
MKPNIASKRKFRIFFGKLIKVFVFCIIIFITTFITLVLCFQNKINKKPLFVTPLAKNNATKTASPVSTDISQTLQNLLDQNNISFTDITIATDSSLLVTTHNGPDIIFSPIKNISQQITSLQLVTGQLTIEGRRAKRIDLRFDNPVVSF